MHLDRVLRRSPTSVIKLPLSTDGFVDALAAAVERYTLDKTVCDHEEASPYADDSVGTRNVSFGAEQDG